MYILFLLLMGCDMSPKYDVTPKARHLGCHSKKQGSTPACWTEQDWQVYCERVQCKPQTKENK